ncbi:hypothetical protein PQC34_gp023 [Cronobacter phage A24]|uniref:Uncharacterized protein n=1 Tax=Cronobacter phage A24 TaxID=2795745 RepID=A0A7T5UEK1_9CAUD|nr:hypothetical protein PQC34_gp023 [Cronobacter phage A24]QQG33711.1 hypothetical protein [Cronobacter phage A24]WAX14182.1 hypothetical protein ECO319P1_00023 [Escherichia phage ECO319P1]
MQLPTGFIVLLVILYTLNALQQEGYLSWLSF